MAILSAAAHHFGEHPSHRALAHLHAEQDRLSAVVTAARAIIAAWEGDFAAGPGNPIGGPGPALAALRDALAAAPPEMATKYGAGPPSAFAVTVQREVAGLEAKLDAEDAQMATGMYRDDGGPMSGLRFKP
ncbi:MAG: hypothetical protein AAB262_09155 [Elusimicrobiota bacterium]